MVTGKMLRDAFISGANRVAGRSGEMNRINLFPVADGDTGANLTLTLGMAKQHLLRMEENCTPAEVIEDTAKYMLRASRGNSGAIFAAMMRGAAVRISSDVPFRDRVFAKELINALSDGVDAAYRAVFQPEEGTMLTVAKKAVRAGKKFLEDLKQGGSDTEDTEFRMWETVLAAAGRALVQTKYEMDILRENDVVDAGALGFVSFLEGMTDVFLGKEMTPEPAPEEMDVEEPYVFDKGKVRRTDGSLPVVTYVVNVSFSDSGSLEEMRKKLDPAADRLTVFMERNTIEAKFSTDDPAGAVRAAFSAGVVEKLYGISHSADFKVSFSEKTKEDKKKMEEADLQSIYSVEFEILKGVRERDLAEHAAGILKQYAGSIWIREESNVIRCAASAADPAEMIAAAACGVLSSGYMTRFAVRRVS